MSEIGIGAWSWGDRSGYWGYGREYGKSESLEAYKAFLFLFILSDVRCLRR